MENTNYYIKVGPYLKELRKKNNMTRSQLANGICSVSYITRIENGNRCPSSVILRQLTNKLGITPEYLFRAIESPASLRSQELLDQIFIYIERHDFNNIYKLINEEKEKLNETSIHDMQIFKTFKCLSETVLSKNYQLGINELEYILDLTYTKGCNPTDIEFLLMLMYGYFLLLNNQEEQAYIHLLNIKKYMDNIKFLHTRAIFPAFYMILITACFDTSNLEESSLYLDTAIDYCKKNNTYSYLRELYFLKGELYYRLKKEKDFKIWYNKSLILHDMIKDSDNEFFNEFIQDRLSKINVTV